MRKVLNSFLDLDDFVISAKLYITNYTLIEIAQKKGSSSQQYIFKTFRSNFHTTKDQKIILQTFYQFNNLKCQYLQIYDHFSFISKDDDTTSLFFIPKRINFASALKGTEKLYYTLCFLISHPHSK